MPFEDFLRPHGINYIVHRTGEPQRVELGLPDKGYIMFRPGTDIKDLDVLENPAGETYHVINTETEFAYQKPHFLKAFYQTEQEYNAAKQAPGPVFNVQNAYGSVIGTNNQATINYNSSVQGLKEKVSQSDSPDKEDMEKIVSLLEMVVNNQVPPSKGLFSKFSEVMERHSWLSNSVAAAILSWLTTKIL